MSLNGRALFRLTAPISRRVTVPLHGDSGDGVVDITKIIGRELDGHRADVLFEAVELGRAGDRNDPWLLRQ